MLDEPMVRAATHEQKTLESRVPENVQALFGGGQGEKGY